MKKKLIIGLASLVLVAAMAIGGTLAFMTQKTAPMTNTFTAAAGLKGEIREPKWDGYSFADAGHDGSEAKSSTDTTLGINQAKAMTPGQEINKNPTLKNTSEVPVFMAIKVTYNEKTKFDAIAAFTLNTGWVESAAGSGIYFYVGTDNKLKAVPPETETATSLFNTVNIKTDATADTLKTNQFTITVMGGAVQTTDLGANADDTAKAQLAALLS